ncbi:hypothetical protein [Phytohabitans kaempferiae]|uniref:Uncharacterized protein n=1 Tax=Phytohabitans kaempferiae TaxID=1620943 RepID=A0ABV6MBJ5_9ACTN
MRATNAQRIAPLVPGHELTQLRHDWLVVVLTRATDPELKQVVLEHVAATSRPTPPCNAMEYR